MRKRNIAIFNLNERMGFATQLTNRLDNFGNTTTIDGVVVTQASTVSIEW
jgi:hypothetical protein